MAGPGEGGSEVLVPAPSAPEEGEVSPVVEGGGGQATLEAPAQVEASAAVGDEGVAESAEKTPEESDLNQQAFAEVIKQDEALDRQLLFSTKRPGGQDLLIFCAIGELPGAGDINSFVAGVDSELGPVVVNRALAQALKETPDDYVGARNKANGRTRLAFEVESVRDGNSLTYWKKRVELSRGLAERVVDAWKAVIATKRDAFDFLRQTARSRADEAPAAGAPQLRPAGAGA